MHLVILLPACVAIYIAMSYGNLSWDWAFHTSGSTLGGYPPITPDLTKRFYDAGGLAFFAIFVFAVIPYLLILKITKNTLASFAYLYATGIPFVLTWVGAVGQGLTHILMLLTVANPFLFAPCLLAGIFIHREAFGAVIVAGVVSIVYRWLK